MTVSKTTKRMVQPPLEEPKGLFEPGWTRGDFLSFWGRVGLAGAGVAAFGPEIFLSGCARKTPEEELMEVSLDVTELVRTAQPGKPLNLERAVAAQLQADPKKAELLKQARERGWNDDALRDTLLEIRAGNMDVRKATATLVGREFGFDRFLLMFKPREDWIVAFPQLGAICLNPIGVTHVKPSEIRQRARSAMPHEGSHVVMWHGATERLERKLPRTPYYNDDAIEQEVERLGRMKQLQEGAVWELGFSEVACDKLGLRFSEGLGRSEAFKRAFRAQVRDELSTYRGMLDGCRKMLGEGRTPTMRDMIHLGSLVEIGGMHAFALYINDAGLANELDRLANDSIDMMCRVTGQSLEGEVRADYDNMLEFLKHTARVIEPRKGG